MHTLNKTLPLLGLLALAGRPLRAQSVFVTRHAQLSFFSATPVENISAKSNATVSAIDTKNRTLYFKVDNTTFEFPHKLMQEHFNENYIESSKYPFSEFRGQFSGPVDVDKDGSYPVTVSGKLKMHGVEKAYELPAVITVKDRKLRATANFDVALKDHDIAIPTLVVAKIAERVKTTVNAEYEPQTAAVTKTK